MAEFDMYGPLQGGARQAGIDIQAQNLSMLTQQKTQAETEHYKALAAQEMQKAAHEKQQAETQQRQQQYMQRVALEHSSESLKDQSAAQMGAGMLVGAADSVQKYSQVLDNLSKMDHADAQAYDKKLESASRVYGFMEQFAQHVPVTGDPKTDQENYIKAVEVLEKKTGHQLPELREIQWNAKERDHVIEQSKSHRDKADEMRKDADEARKEKETAARIKLEEARAALVTEQKKALRQKEEKTEKAGGKAAVRTPREDVKLVSNLIKNDFPGMNSDDPGAAATAELVAAGAQEKLAKNRGLSRDQALSQAYAEAKKSGMITSITTEKHKWIGPNEQVTTPKFNPTGDKKEGGDIAKDERAAAIKKDYQEGKLTREQAAAKLKAL